MKIAMVDPSLFTGRYDDALCAALADRGHDVVLKGRPLRDTDAIEPAAYRYDPCFFRWSEPIRSLLGDGPVARAAKAADYAIQALSKPLSRADVDVVHVQWTPFAPVDRKLFAAARRTSALVHTVHNARPLHGDGGSAQSAGYDELLALCDMLIVHGDKTKNALLERGVAADQISVVSHPPMRLARASSDDVAVVRPLSSRVRVLFFGTIRPYKGLDLLIDAMMALWDSGVDAELAIAGKPFLDVMPWIERIHAAGHASRLIADLGFLSEGRLDAHLRAADIVVFPYRAIDASGAMLSATTYGAALVTSAVGMFADIGHYEQGGPLMQVPPDNSAALSSALAVLIRDKALRQQLGQRAQQWHDEQPGWMDAAAQTEVVYGDALERAKQRKGRE